MWKVWIDSKGRIRRVPDEDEDDDEEDEDEDEEHEWMCPLLLEDEEEEEEDDDEDDEDDEEDDGDDKDDEDEEEEDEEEEEEEEEEDDSRHMHSISSSTMVFGLMARLRKAVPGAKLHAISAWWNGKFLVKDVTLDIFRLLVRKCWDEGWNGGFTFGLAAGGSKV